MRQFLFATAMAIASLVFSGPCFASRVDADACAAKLPADAKLVYAAVIGSVAPNADLDAIVRTKTRALVTSGQLNRGKARAAAEAAGSCLKQAR